MSLGLIIAAWGLWLLWTRWQTWPRLEPSQAEEAREVPKVSVIVPARNEIRVLPRLLDSLLSLDYSDYEVIVVDDGSSDGTGDVARLRRDDRLSVITAPPRPAGWGGKHWACHSGSRVARGAVLLFTDADTFHEKDSLRRAVAELRRTGAGMLSCLPCHEGLAWWERLAGAFHVLLLTVTAPLSKPRPGRVFAIGQYLMFRRDAYDLLGGHEAVKGEFVEDLPMANRCLAEGVRYTVLADGSPLFRVRMYETLPEFVRGWRRNFRAGLGGSSVMAPAEMTAMIFALCGAGGAAGWPLALGVSLVAVLLVGRAQRRLGNFHWLGALVFPWGVSLLCAATALSVSDMVMRRSLVWKGRAYG